MDEESEQNLRTTVAYTQKLTGLAEDLIPTVRRSVALRPFDERPEVPCSMSADYAIARLLC